MRLPESEQERYVSTTVNGIGERAGNAAFEEVVMALKLACEIDPEITTTDLASGLSRYVATASGRPVAALEGGCRRKGLFP
jgi:homocitrate synthase NifV